MTPTFPNKLALPLHTPLPALLLDYFFLAHLATSLVLLALSCSPIRSYIPTSYCSVVSTVALLQGDA